MTLNLTDIPWEKELFTRSIKVKNEVEDRFIRSIYFVVVVVVIKY